MVLNLGDELGERSRVRTDVRIYVMIGSWLGEEQTRRGESLMGY
jgi:hypothetical protein